MGKSLLQELLVATIVRENKRNLRKNKEERKKRKEAVRRLPFLDSLMFISLNYEGHLYMIFTCVCIPPLGDVITCF